MRIIAESNLKAFYLSHADVQEQISSWIADTNAASWQTSHDVKAAYASASVLGNNRVCFNIKGNAYRLIAAIDYRSGIVLIKFIGTHADYSKIDADKVDMFRRG